MNVPPAPAAVGVSVIVPVRNGARYLAETLDSLVTQSLPPGEIIVVDDGSTDDSAALAASASSLVRVISTDGGLGPEGARKMGLEASRASLFAFCDADDLWAEAKLAAQVAMIDDVAHPTVVWAGVVEFVSPEIDPTDYRGRTPRSVPRGRLVSAMLGTRSILTDLPWPGDAGGSWIEWVASLPPSVQQLHVGTDLVRRRLHLTNHSSTPDHPSESWLALARRRAAADRSESR